MMATFVLVHGAFHGAWCWTKLIPELEARGHRAVAIDMPGNGEDRTPHREVTLEGYAQRIGTALKAEPAPVILVGHSLGSMAVSLAAERFPDRLQRLVYLAGCVPTDGHSLYTFMESMDHPGEKIASMPPPGHPWHGLANEPNLDTAREVFYNDCSPEDVAFALPRLCTQPNAPRVTPIRLSSERYGRVRRTFIGCIKDRAMTPFRQKITIEQAGCEPNILLPADHSPFLTMPARLADELVSLV
jgi:pimeloyl-ACP methyl ester carboxylesterase